MKLKNLYRALLLFAAFGVWTLAVEHLDVQPIGPMASSVGLATLNQFVHRLTGVHMALYTLTDWLSLIPIGVGMGFALLGLAQWIRRKRLLRVDGSLLVLGGFYLITLGLYLLFEVWVVNRRPVLIDGYLEASYPSSTTLLVLCFMPTAILQLRSRIRSVPARRIMTAVLVSFTLFMVVGRLISGVHWFSDIVGGLWLSAGLVQLYRFACECLPNKTKPPVN